MSKHSRTGALTDFKYGDYKSNTKQEDTISNAFLVDRSSVRNDLLLQIYCRTQSDQTLYAMCKTVINDFSGPK